MQSKPRSFVLRKGRITSAQQDALTNLWSRYVLEVTSDELDLELVFDNKNPVVVDIGFGTGETLLYLAKNNPLKNFLGIEVYMSGIGSSLAKAGLSDLSNLKIINRDAELVFKENISNKSLEGAVLFYPDPWPKRKHHKRRLVQEDFLNLIKNKQPNTWDMFLRTASRADTETIFQKESIITLNEYFYGKSRLYLCAPLHPKHCIHPIYKWGQAVDIRVDVEPLLKMSINELKKEMKKTPKFLRTIRSNKAPIIIDAEYGMKVEPYNAMDLNLIKQRAQLVRNNEKFSQNILTALREIAEEKEQLKSQEDIYAEESIYTKFTSNKDTALFPAWHAASWKDKLNLLDKFEDKRLVGFGKKIIYQEAPEVLPPDMLRTIKMGIAKRILSEKREKWWTVSTCFMEIDTLRDKYSNENDQAKLKFLDELNIHIMSVQKKYENV